MTTKTLLMLAAAGLLTPTAIAHAGAITTTKVVAAPVNDKAPVNNNGRLKKTNEEQTPEMPAIVMFGSKGLYFQMSTEIQTANGPQGAPNRTQCSLTKIELVQDTATGAVSVKAPAVGDTRFITNNLDTNDYRNCNHPVAFKLTDTIGCLEYNVQPDNSNDTKNYVQCFTADGERVLNQTQVFAKNNDDASQRADGEIPNVTHFDAATGKAQVCQWRGANGNGRDDGWVQCYNLTVAGNAVTFSQGFDVSVAQREERTRGNVSFSQKDPNTLIATYSLGNTQPTRDGVWMAAIDVTPGKYKGANQQDSILWKQMIRGRVDNKIGEQTIRTYAMRAHHTRVMEEDPATGKLVRGDNVIFYANDLRGNNLNNEKGGRIVAMQMGVIKATKAGMEFVQPLANHTQTVRNIGGTHTVMINTVVGEVGKLKPGFLMFNGAHTGGGRPADGRAVAWDGATKALLDLGKLSSAPMDRHLYSNYLGNNPGNQGRNYSAHTLIENPFFDATKTTAAQDKHLVLFATTGKDTTDAMDSKIKTSGFITVIPVTSVPPAPTPSNPEPSTETQNPPTTPDEPGTTPEQPEPTEEETLDGSDTTLGGCSTGPSTPGTGLVTFLLIGLAAFIRRRR